MDKTEEKFVLDERLKENLILLGSFDLSFVFFTPDSDNPWIVLVPRVANITEWHQISEREQQSLLKEINIISKVLELEFKPDKINIGALGNIVSQFHLHIIARYRDDRAWPHPIWGTTQGQNRDVINQRVEKLKEKLF